MREELCPKEHLTRHARSHSNAVARHVCSVCQREFTRGFDTSLPASTKPNELYRDSLQRHLVRHGESYKQPHRDAASVLVSIVMRAKSSVTAILNARGVSRKALSANMRALIRIYRCLTLLWMFKCKSVTLHNLVYCQTRRTPSTAWARVLKN